MKQQGAVEGQMRSKKELTETVAPKTHGLLRRLADGAGVD